MENDNQKVLTVGKNKHITAAEINEFIGLSDSNSEDSDWDEIKEVKADDFLVKKDENEIKVVKKVFTKQKITSDKKENSDVKFEAPAKFIKSNQNNTNNDNGINPKLFANKNSKYFVAAPTKIRVSNPQISNEIWESRTSGRQVFPVSRLYREKMSNSLTDSDWVLVGVIVQFVVKSDKNGSKFMIWYLNDLQNLDKSVKVMLFRDAYKSFWKEPNSTVVAILKPKLLPSTGNFKDMAFTVDAAMQIVILGLSPDFGICPGKSKSGESCRNFVNKDDCNMCSYHIQDGYLAALTRPGFGNIGLEKFNERKRKAAFASSVNEKRQKMNGAIINESVQKKVSLETLKNNGITKLAAQWGLLDQDNSVVNCVASPSTPGSTQNSKLTELLKRPSAGSMNFVKHIVEKSVGPSAIASNIARQCRPFDNSQPTASPDLTIREIVKRFKSPNPNLINSNANKYVDLGISKSVINTEQHQAELNKLRLAALVRNNGSYTQMKENNRLERIKQQVALASSMRKPNETEKVVSKKVGLSKEQLESLNRGSINKHLVDIEKSAEMDDRLDRMEKIEKIEMKLTEQQEQPCILFFCRQCKTKLPKKSCICVSEGHTFDTINGVRRFFRCIKCKHRTTTFEKYPDHSCLKCGACAFEKTGKIKEREVAEEKLLVCGEEKRFINN